MKLDCQNMACPEPVIKTKKAIENLSESDILEVKLNSLTSIENVTRFATNQGYSVTKDGNDEKATLFISKGFTCKTVKKTDDERFIDTTLFLKDDKIGEGELGNKLVIGFLKSTLEQEKLPKRIICVNRAVLLTSADENSESVKVFKALEDKGIEIFSCGICLEYFKKEKDLKVGKIGNAFSTIEMLLKGAVSL
ncbi:MAG: sulfurtransferase-like selenium metabolism protein YedF [Campylobacteraceae bacterium]